MTAARNTWTQRWSMENTRGDDALRTTFNLLFVCTGNTCRSPLAEVLARAGVERRGWRHVQVASAGTSAESGYEASPHAATVAGRHGLDLGSHASRQLTGELVDWADLILAMSPGHLAAVDFFGGGAKVSLLGSFAAAEEGGATAVHDPYGRDEAAYQRTFEELQDLVDRSLDRLAPIVDP